MTDNSDHQNKTRQGKRRRSKSTEKATKKSRNPGYYATANGLELVQEKKGEMITKRLTNFTAKLTGDITKHNGVERQRFFELSSPFAEKPFAVPASNFGSTVWIREHLGPQAIIYTGCERDVPVAIQSTSGQIPKRQISTHTGWAQINGVWVYFTASGPLGPVGPASGIEVELSEDISRYSLPPPPQDPKAAIVASLNFLEVAPLSITLPIFAAIYRAPLGSPDLSLHMAGQTGAGKTELAARGQQHFGKEMHARNLPANWSSTANALEDIAFHAKDTVLVIDDFVPRHNSDCYEKAERLFRALGNKSGRQRMTADINLRPERPPRALIVSTGEDIPKGHSLRARMIVIEVSPNCVNWEKLSACQVDGASGLYAEAMSAYIQFVSSSWRSLSEEQVRQQLESEVERLRVEFSQSHRRTSANLAQLALGLEWFIKFADEHGALPKKEELRDEWFSVLKTVGMAQDAVQTFADPVDLFLETLRNALASKRVHLASVGGGQLENPEACGWVPLPSAWGEPSWQARGEKIGWMEGQQIYLIPAAAFSAVNKLSRECEQNLGVQQQTLWRRLADRKLLRSCEPSRYTVRKTIGGSRQKVLHMNSDLLLPPEAGQVGQPGQSSELARPDSKAAGDENEEH